MKNSANSINFINFISIYCGLMILGGLILLGHSIEGRGDGGHAIAGAILMVAAAYFIHKKPQ